MCITSQKDGQTDGLTDEQAAGIQTERSHAQHSAAAAAAAATQRQHACKQVALARAKTIKL